MISQTMKEVAWSHPLSVSFSDEDEEDENEEEEVSASPSMSSGSMEESDEQPHIDIY